MKISELKNKLSGYLGGFFGVRNYENQNGEISNYVVNVKVNYDKLKIKDIETCKNFNTSNEIEIQAKNALLTAFLKPTDATKNRQNGQIDAYIYICDGVKMHKESLDLFFVGQRVSKKVLVAGIYPTVNSKPLTIAKNKIRKNFSTTNYRSFKIGNLDEIKDIILSDDKKSMDFVL